MIDGVFEKESEAVNEELGCGGNGSTVSGVRREGLVKTSEPYRRFEAAERATIASKSERPGRQMTAGAAIGAEAEASLGIEDGEGVGAPKV